MTVSEGQPKDCSGWTIETLAVYHSALREADLRFQEERDRRYRELAIEKEKALQIKDRADRDALELARQIQVYKDEKANDLREQIGSERGLYATKSDIIALSEKFEASHKPVVEFMAQSMGKGIGISTSAAILIGGVGLLATMLSIGAFVFGRSENAPSSTPPPQVIYVPAPPGTTIPVTPPQSVPR